jgi:hypothetical protein
LEYIPKYGVNPDPYYFDQIGLIPHSKRVIGDILGYLFALSILAHLFYFHFGFLLIS